MIMQKLIVLIFLWLLFLACVITDSPYKIFLLLFLAVAIVIADLYRRRTILGRPFNGDCIIRKQSERMGLSSLFLALTFTILDLTEGRSRLNFALIFYTFFASEFIWYWMVKKLKPIYIVIENNILYINRPHLIKREISQITEINWTKVGDLLTIHFSDAPPITLDRDHYLKDDVFRLLAKFFEINPNTIRLNENAKELLSNSSEIAETIEI